MEEDERHWLAPAIKLSGRGPRKKPVLSRKRQGDGGGKWHSPHGRWTGREETPKAFLSKRVGGLKQNKEKKKKKNEQRLDRRKR